MKKLLNLFLALILVISAGSFTVLASEKQDESSPIIKRGTITAEERMITNADIKFKQAYPATYYHKWEDVKAPNGTLYTAIETADKDYDLDDLAAGTVKQKLYLLVLKPKTSEYEVLDITGLAKAAPNTYCGKLEIFAPTNDRILIACGYNTVDKTGKEEYSVKFTENHGLLMDTKSKTLIKDLPGGVSSSYIANGWTVTDTHAYTAEKIYSEEFNKATQSFSYKTGKVRAYSLKDGALDHKFTNK